MLAVDTNVLVRLLANDDPKQGAAAARLLRSEPIWVANTVLVETEWVLRNMYKFPPSQIQEALTRLLGIPHVTVEARPTVSQALHWMAEGLDFADALHLASSQRQGPFVTFDEKLAKHCKRLGLDARLLA